MSLTMRSIRNVAALAAKKNFSTVSPKVAIGQNILYLDSILAAKDEAALQAVVSGPKPVVDPSNLPQRLEDMKAWYTLDTAASTDKFIPNPNAWQNKGFWEYVADEGTRAETWPFFVGFLVMNILVGLHHLTIDEETKKNSRMTQLMEGKWPETHGHGDHHEDAHAAHH